MATAILGSAALAATSGIVEKSVSSGIKAIGKGISRSAKGLMHLIGNGDDHALSDTAFDHARALQTLVKNVNQAFNINLPVPRPESMTRAEARTYVNNLLSSLSAALARPATYSNVNARVINGEERYKCDNPRLLEDVAMSVAGGDQPEDVEGAAERMQSLGNFANCLNRLADGYRPTFADVAGSTRNASVVARTFQLTGSKETGMFSMTGSLPISKDNDVNLFGEEDYRNTFSVTDGDATTVDVTIYGGEGNRVVGRLGSTDIPVALTMIDGAHVQHGEAMTSLMSGEITLDARWTLVHDLGQGTPTDTVGFKNSETVLLRYMTAIGYVDGELGQQVDVQRVIGMRHLEIVEYNEGTLVWNVRGADAQYSRTGRMEGTIDNIVVPINLEVPHGKTPVLITAIMDNDTPIELELWDGALNESQAFATMRGYNPWGGLEDKYLYLSLGFGTPEFAPGNDAIVRCSVAPGICELQETARSVGEELPVIVKIPNADGVQQWTWSGTEDALSIGDGGYGYTRRAARVAGSLSPTSAATFCVADWIKKFIPNREAYDAVARGSKILPSDPQAIFEGPTKPGTSRAQFFALCAAELSGGRAYANTRESN